MLQLIPIALKDHQKLFKLMQQIYPPAYKYLWQNEDCTWYINSQYGINNFQSELNQTNSDYFFIEYDNENIGILRLVYNIKESTTKLHRLYLSPSCQGKGIGKRVMRLSEELALDNNSKSIWLEVMETKTQALQFYENLGFSIEKTYQLPFELIHEELRGIYKMSKLI